jgi:cytochrome c-type biogenesis protein CcmF
LIGTIYPIFLEIIANEKISIGSPYYNTILAPFVIPLLLLMSYGPKANWLVYKPTRLKKSLSILFLSVFLIIIFIYFTNQKNILINLILVSSIYLIIQTFLDLLKNLSKKNFPLYASIFSHLGFGFLIFFISLNSIFSVEHDFNIKIGEKRKLENLEITLQDLKIYSEKNYKKFVGKLMIFYNKNNSVEFLNPEIRIYDQPKTITYEASIKSDVLSDTYVTMSNISRSDFYNIKFQKKPFMNLIWFSAILIAFGGFIRVLERRIK